jgi:hypothetical protein
MIRLTSILLRYPALQWFETKRGPNILLFLMTSTAADLLLMLLLLLITAVRGARYKAGKDRSCSKTFQNYLIVTQN